MRTIDSIYVHHSASSQMETIRKMIDQWHKDRGWNGVGYHFFIEADGGIQKGRDVAVVGAHCRGHNRRSIGICITGNFQNDTILAAQELSLKILLTGLMNEYNLTKTNVFGHRENGSTLCPGDSLFAWLQTWREPNDHNA